MKKIVLTFLLLASVISACAQYRHWEHNIYAGNGLIAEYKGREGDPYEGISFVVGYGLAYRFSPHWSVMPGVAWRAIGPLGESFDGADDDAFWFVDIPLLGRYHTGIGKRNWTFGIGPALSFCVRNETFYVDADPHSPLNHLDKCKAFTLGLQPTASYQFATSTLVLIASSASLTRSSIMEWPQAANTSTRSPSAWRLISKTPQCNGIGFYFRIPFPHLSHGV